MKIRRARAGVLVALSLASVTACGSGEKPAREDSQDVVSFVHDIPSGHPRLPYFDEFVDAVGVRSGNSLDVRINPQEAVLAGRASLDAVLAGEANIAAVNMAHLEAMEPTAGFMNLPFGLNDTIMTDNRKQEAVTEALGAQLRPHDVELLGLMRGADQLFAFAHNDVRRLEDLQGRRIRVAGGGIYEQTMRELGAEPVPIPITQIKETMASGTIDGVFTSPGGWSTEILHDAPHAVQVRGLMFITYGLVANGSWLAGLSEQERTAVTEAGARMTAQWASMQNDDQEVIERAVSDGGTYFDVPDSEVARWQNSVAGISTHFLTEHPQLAVELEQKGLFGR